jgi:hypothetical protein
MHDVILNDSRGRVITRIPLSGDGDPVPAAARLLAHYGAASAIVVAVDRRPSPVVRRAEPTGEDVDTWCDARGIESELRESIRARSSAEPWKLLRDVAREARERRAQLRRGARRRVAR